MPESEFFHPRLCGPRFQEGAIPLEVLKDIAAIGDMTIEVAKWKYLLDHPQLKRTPKRFTDGIEFKLSRIDKGSAIPVIVMEDNPAEESELLPTAFQGYFYKARDAIIDAIEAIEKEDEKAQYFPAKYFKYLRQMVRHLHEGEYIEFITPSSHRRPRLTREIGHLKPVANRMAINLSQNMILRGTIPEIDQDKMTFELQPIYGNKVGAPISEQFYDIIFKTFNGYQDTARVLLQGIGIYDRKNIPAKLESVESITPLHPLDIPSQLDDFRHMQDGWLEGEGIAPSHDGLDWLTATFTQLYQTELPLPYIYPTPEGGVLAEWSLQSNDASLEIDLEHHTAEWHLLDMDTDQGEMCDLNLDEDATWDWIADRLRKLSGEQNQK